MSRILIEEWSHKINKNGLRKPKLLNETITAKHRGKQFSSPKQGTMQINLVNSPVCNLMVYTSQIFYPISRHKKTNPCMLFAQQDEFGSARNSAEVLESDFHELDALR